MDNEGSNNIFGVDMGGHNTTQTTTTNSLNNVQSLQDTSSTINTTSVPQNNPSPLSSASNTGVKQQPITNNQPLPSSQSDLKSSSMETQSVELTQPSAIEPQAVNNQPIINKETSPIMSSINSSSLSQPASIINNQTQSQPAVLPTNQVEQPQQAEQTVSVSNNPNSFPPINTSQMDQNANQSVSVNESVGADDAINPTNIPFEVPMSNGNDNLNNINPITQSPNNMEQPSTPNNNGVVPPITNNNETNNNDHKKKFPIKLIIIIGISVVALILIFLLIMKFTKKTEDDSDVVETEQITCSKTAENTIEEYIFEFDLTDNSLISAYMDKSVSYEGDGTGILDELTKEQQTLNNNGISADVSEGDSTYYLTYSADADTYQSYYSDKQLSTKEQISKEYTNQGYTCE